MLSTVPDNEGHALAGAAVLIATVISQHVAGERVALTLIERMLENPNA